MRIVYLLITLLAVSALAHGATLKVPSQHPTIQDAINAAMNGDTVLVSDGTYVENIDFLGKAITVTSVNGADMTIIDGNQSGSVVTFNNGEGLASVLEGFTVTNGSGILLAHPTFTYGGGIHCDSASPTIRNNVITKNLSSFGGGIYGRFDASPIITGNTITSNSIDREGAGMIFVIDCSPIITNNIVADNSAGLFGGGMEFYSNCTLTITNNDVRGNTAVQYSGGGILIGTNCSGTVAENNISGNSANRAGGLFCSDNSDLVIVHNTITENHGSTYGGGIYCLDDTPSITGNNISQNTAGSGSAGIHVTWNNTGSSPDVKSNIIMDNTVSNGSGGGIGIYESSGIYTNNVICTNKALTGAGIFCSQNTSPLFVSNTIFGNSAKNNAGGIKCNTNSTVEIHNTIFWNNELTSGTVGPQIWVGGASKLTISYSDVEGGQNVVFVAPNSKLDWGAGMINADPLFVDEGIGDLHIVYTSPCCETGDNAMVLPGDTDFEGDPRIAYGASATVDMGADEHYYHLYYTGDATPGGSIELKLTGLPGTSPVGLFAGSLVYNPPLKSMWGEWYIYYPWIGPISLGSMPAPDGVLVIPGSIPGSPPGPYTLYLQAIIGDVLTNLCIINVK